MRVESHVVVFTLIPIVPYPHHHHTVCVTWSRIQNLPILTCWQLSLNKSLHIERHGMLMLLLLVFFLGNHLLPFFPSFLPSNVMGLFQPWIHLCFVMIVHKHVAFAHKIHVCVCVCVLICNAWNKIAIDITCHPHPLFLIGNKPLFFFLCSFVHFHFNST